MTSACPAGMLATRPEMAAWGQLDDDVPPVGRMRPSPHQPGSLEAVGEHRDGAGRQRQPLAQLALGQRPGGLEMFERVEISLAKAGAARERRAHTVPLKAEFLQAGGEIAACRRSHVEP